MPPSAGPHWWEVVSSIGAAVGAGAGAVGATAAWRAATASRATSRDALEALAVGIRPRLKAEFGVLHRGDEHGQPTGAQLAAWVTNEAEWAATDVTLDVEFRDGRHVGERTERLDAHPRVDPTPHAEQWTVTLGEVPAGAQSIHSHGKEAILRYSDERGIARYQITYGFVFRQGTEGPITSTFSAIDVDERRI